MALLVACGSASADLAAVRAPSLPPVHAGLCSAAGWATLNSEQSTAGYGGQRGLSWRLLRDTRLESLQRDARCLDEAAFLQFGASLAARDAEARCGVGLAAPPTTDGLNSVGGCPAGEQSLTLPPTPASGSLVLTGLLTLGVLHAGRSARQMQFGALPEWYHASAVQLGHSTPFVPDTPALASCPADQPLVAKPSCHRRILDLEDALSEPQSFLTLFCPRGPPQPT